MTTKGEAERLAYFMEECAEAIAATGKILRHGYDSANPVDPGPDNRAMLEEEIADIGFAVRMLVDSGDVDATEIAQMVAEKERSAERWFHHQEKFFNACRTHDDRVANALATLVSWHHAHTALNTAAENTLDGFDETFSDAESLLKAVARRCLEQVVQSDWTPLGDTPRAHRFRAVLREADPHIAIEGTLEKASVEGAWVVVRTETGIESKLDMTPVQNAAVRWYARTLSWQG